MVDTWSSLQRDNFFCRIHIRVSGYGFHPMLFKDTIAAISTPIGPGSIGVIRISGPLSIIIASTLASRNPSELHDHSALHTILFDPVSGVELDDTMLTAFHSPASYTGEDVVEISCHGSVPVLRSVLNAVLASGCRLAEPGEFTKRAYMNGKLDLSQAEAVNDLIRSRTEGSRRSALSQLHGGLSRRLARLDKHLLDMLALIEASIDFPDDVDEPELSWILEEVALCTVELVSLEATFRGGKILREGARVVICGSVNVGKSSLLNALLKRERAIVTPIPGTTRDLIEEGLEIRGIPLTAIDTAGIRDTSDPVESAGLDMAMNTINNADLVMLVLEASRKPVYADLDAILQTEPGRCILVINKMDIELEGSAEACRRLVEKHIGYGIPVAEVSASSETGIEQLESQIYDKLVAGVAIESVVVTNVRHHQAIVESIAALQRVRDGMNLGHPLDLLCIDIADARRYVGLITGETVGEDVLESIFSQFCIGK